jgi:hypothetical protein
VALLTKNMHMKGFDTKWCYKIKNFVQGGGRVGIKVKEDISPYF